MRKQSAGTVCGKLETSKMCLDEVMMYEIIINPESKCGKGKAVWEQVQSYMDGHGITYHVNISGKMGDAREIAERMVFPEDVPPEERVLIVIGGDGTLNEVVNGLKSLCSVRIGYIPAGSGNDFARNLKIPKNVLRACELIFEKKRLRRLDYGVNCAGKEEIQNRRFLVSSGIGFDAAICHEMNYTVWKKKLNRMHMGKLVYIIFGLRQVIRSKPADGEMILDNERKIHLQKAYFVSCHILKTEGGGFPFGKKADPADGRLTLCVFQNMGKVKFVLALLMSLLGGHQDIFSGVHFYGCKEVQIRMDEPMAVHADGESCRVQKEMTVCCVGQHFQVYC